jgi:hypothetical protein
MNRNHLLAIIGGIIGLILGLIIGGYLGLVFGGTLLGGFDIYEWIGIEGYELTTYIGAIFGAVALTFVGVKLGSKRSNIPNNK